MTYPFIDLIGIAGRKGAGKDTAAGLLIRDHGFTLVKFATPLKDMLRTYLRLLGLDEVMIERLIEGDLKETPSEYFLGKTSRWAQQSLGTEWGRVLIGDKLWTYAFDKRRQLYPKSVCTDLRFPNEETTIKDAGGYTIKIVDPNFIKPENDHASEAAIDDMKVDKIFINDKTKHSKEEFADIVISGLRMEGVI